MDTPTPQRKRTISHAGRLLKSFAVPEFKFLLFAFGLMAINYPLLSIFSQDGSSVYHYLFIFWLAFIPALILANARDDGVEEEEETERKYSERTTRTGGRDV